MIGTAAPGIPADAPTAPYIDPDHGLPVRIDTRTPGYLLAIAMLDRAFRDAFENVKPSSNWPADARDSALRWIEAGNSGEVGFDDACSEVGLCPSRVRELVHDTLRNPERFDVKRARGTRRP